MSKTGSWSPAGNPVSAWVARRGEALTVLTTVRRAWFRCARVTARSMVVQHLPPSQDAAGHTLASLSRTNSLSTSLSSGRVRTSRTGTVAPRTTRSATLPISQRLSPERPHEQTTIKSTWFFFGKLQDRHIWSSFHSDSLCRITLFPNIGEKLIQVCTSPLTRLLLDRVNVGCRHATDVW
jgi:hypothetical protein